MTFAPVNYSIRSTCFGIFVTIGQGNEALKQFHFSNIDEAQDFANSILAEILLYKSAHETKPL